MTAGRGLLVPGAALLALAAPAVVAWSSLVGGFAVAVLPVAALAAAALTGRRPARRAAGAVAVWVLAAPLLAGVPPDQLASGAWATLPARLFGGVQQLMAPGGVTAAADPWPLAAGLLLAGTSWIAAAALARRRTGAALAAGALPWVAAALLRGTHASVWQGAAILLAGLVWHAWPRTSGRAAVALSVVVALASGITAEAAAPPHRWLEVPGLRPHTPSPFQRLEIEPTFEPLAHRQTSAPLLEITASAPAFWRLQALDVFDGRGWGVSSRSPRLPEPAAQPERVDVHVDGLENDVVASPGAIDAVRTAGSAHPVEGTAWRLVPGPDPGDSYRVAARVVRADAAELRRATAPRDPRLAAYTRLGSPERRGDPGPAVLHIGPFVLNLRPAEADAQPRGFPVDVPPFGDPSDARTTARLGRSPYRGVAALARRLAAGAGTEWEVVARVVHYLRDEDRFRYTTDVSPPGAFPLVDFLLRTHAGYCQHFAGAAALLLRLAGVPTRVIAGFSPGVRSGGRFQVRALDAHDWIEVYFAGYGWVPFNPTPAASPAAIPPELDLFAATGARAPMRNSLQYAIVGVIAGVMLVGARRARRAQMGDALARLVERPVLPSTTLGQLADELARALGPHTAALAAEAERARFGREGPVRQRWTSARIASALARDVGLCRALRLLARPTTGSASAGAQASPPAARGRIA